jgi:hypothetical protein
MARIVAFEPRTRREGDTRYPRFEEVAAHIDRVAGELFDATRTLMEGRRLHAELRGMISSEALELLNRFYETFVTHEEKFEHAAYVVGLQAATGRLSLATKLVSERNGDISFEPYQRTSS